MGPLWTDRVLSLVHHDHHLHNSDLDHHPDDLHNDRNSLLDSGLRPLPRAAQGHHWPAFICDLEHGWQCVHLGRPRNLSHTFSSGCKPGFGCPKHRGPERLGSLARVEGGRQCRVMGFRGAIGMALRSGANRDECIPRGGSQG